MKTHRLHTMLLSAAIAASPLLCARAASGPAERERDGKARLEKDLAIARQKGRPDWLAKTPLEVQLTANYQQIRREVDTRFFRGESRQAVKLLYAIVDGGSETMKKWARGYLPDGLVWADEPAFAIETLGKPAGPYPLLTLARCYLRYDQYTDAAAAFEKAIAAAPVEHADQVNGKALWGLGDTARGRGDFPAAKDAYAKARDAFDTAARAEGKPAWYVTGMKKEAARMQLMINLCEAANLNVSRLKPGTWTGTAEGYDGPLTVSVTIDDGRISAIDVVEQVETIPLNSLTEIPRMIVSSQSPSVDAITGATVTSAGVMGAVLKALEQARQQ